MSKREDPPADDCPADAVEFLRGLRDLQSTDTFCDVVLKGSDESWVCIPCHRSVLSVQSPYFRAVFSLNWKESSEPEYKLKPEQHRQPHVKKFAYTMNLSLSDDSVVPILIAAQFLQMTPAARMCWDYVEKRMCLANCLAVHTLASQHHNPRLGDAALCMIYPHFLRFSHSHDFLQMDAQQLTALIASDDVEVFSEDHVLDAVLRRLNYDRPGRLAHAQTVLHMVRVAFSLPAPPATRECCSLANAAHSRMLHTRECCTLSNAAHSRMLL
ncbi:kelch-like protein 7 [Paramacrobiotus metropolitanus]|uniref:kelch-like protein 7 n=1 Tax=Paramacrobiotus metropolitanus TaxID=2943436 RepID=UPI002445ED5E|nr:kelch-like protein 7 [Paramacrobiotus metropolitanus]